MPQSEHLTNSLGIQYLEEDPRVNRVDDSLSLFTAVCASKLLKGTSLVLLLNKVTQLPSRVSPPIDIPGIIGRYPEAQARLGGPSQEVVRHSFLTAVISDIDLFPQRDELRRPAKYL